MDFTQNLTSKNNFFFILVTPCPVEPCELHHGQDYSIDISFDEDVEDELSLEICGYIGPLCVPFPTDTPKQTGKYPHTLIIRKNIR